jgi:hypothetical protein
MTKKKETSEWKIIIGLIIVIFSTYLGTASISSDSIIQKETQNLPEDIQNEDPEIIEPEIIEPEIIKGSILQIEYSMQWLDMNGVGAITTPVANIKNTGNVPFKPEIEFLIKDGDEILGSGISMGYSTSYQLLPNEEIGIVSPLLAYVYEKGNYDLETILRDRETGEVLDIKTIDVEVR